MDHLVVPGQFGQDRVDRVGPPGQGAAQRSGDAQQQPGVGQAGREHQGTGLLQAADDLFQAGGDARQVERAAQRVVHADEQGRGGRRQGHRLGQLLGGHVPDERAGYREVAELHLAGRGQRVGQQHPPSHASPRPAWDHPARP